ncbi:MAG: alkaline phosphatase D family protein [Nannocystaceae bacterium]
MTRLWSPRRRTLLSGAAALLACRGRTGGDAVAEGSRPRLPEGAFAGDVGVDSALLWSRCDRPATMVVEYALGGRTHRVVGPRVDAASDFVGHLDLRGLPSGHVLEYSVFFEGDDGRASDPARGRLRTAPGGRQRVRLLWSGDTAGQGWGIDPARGGMATYAAMLARDPDLFVHCGDQVYADAPIPAEQPTGDGEVWRNLTTPARSKVAETLAEFRAAYRYNFLDEHFRRFHAAVATIHTWDDHEVLNNWYPGERLDDPRYHELEVDVLAERGRQAFREHTAIASPTIHRVIRYGPLLDLFVVDLRSLRGANGPGLDVDPTASPLMGSSQIAWLGAELAASKALWKIVVCSQPIGLLIPDQVGFEGIANGDPGGPRGRELEIAGLLSLLRGARVRNVVWLTADVHYTAAHHYDPARAAYADFDPFWEFVSGPLHAGAFGPTAFDPTFGPEVRFLRAPPPGQENRAPSLGDQFFGEVEIDESQTMIVTLRDRQGASLWSIELPPRT